MELLSVHTHTKTPCLRVRTLIADIVQVLFPGGSWLLCKWVVWDRQVLWLRLPASLVWVSVSSENADHNSVCLTELLCTVNEHECQALHALPTAGAHPAMTLGLKCLSSDSNFAPCSLQGLGKSLHFPEPQLNHLIE